jgi:adenylate cyclase
LSGERVERRLAAILAADVAGYSRLMGEDEAGTLARLRTYRRELIDPQIAEHKGRVVKTTGDGLLLEFPSVVEAVACAVTVQRGIAEQNAGIPEDQQIVFRVGVNLGDIIVDGDDIHGDGVNVAARLEALAEPGGICISGTVRDHIGDRLTLVFDDLGDQNIKNIARPVNVYRVRFADAPLPPKPSAALALPDKPSIAVLPFHNMSNDPDQEFFGDGIAEDIITALSRYPSLFVIARNSCFTYKRRAVDMKQIRRELGVRYILEGSLRKSANRIRVTAQLVEAVMGNNVWAEHYDRDLADIFAVQDEITHAVTIAIAPAIAGAEQQRAMRKPPGNLDAWGAYQQGLWYLSKANADDNATAEKLFQQAIDLDPTFTGGYTGLAWAKIAAGGVHLTGNLADLMKSAEALARQAIAIDHNDPETHVCLSGVLRVQGDTEGAVLEAEQALALSPNLASAHRDLGQALIFSGRPMEGLSALEICGRLDPHAVNSAVRLTHMAIGLYFSHNYEAAATTAQRAIRRHPGWPQPYRWLAAALGQLGRTREAKGVLEKTLEVDPASFDMYVHTRPPWYRSEDHSHMIEGLRKVGWTG